MAKSPNQKLKLLYIVRMLSEYTDETHLLTTQDIIDKLEANDISAERKSIYDDIAQLTEYGYDIIQVRSRTAGGYYLASREFELAELKLLVDAVQSSRFITVKKSRELIKKLERLAGRHEARQLQRQVYVSGRVKTENESIYYNVDTIHKAIQDNVRIQFTYLEWTLNRELLPRKSGRQYIVSPWALLWQDENYYLAAYDSDAAVMKHYRVDKMGQVKLTQESRTGMEQFEKVDLAEYTKQTFGMFGGEQETVTLEMTNRLIGVVMDRFGKEAEIRTKEADTFMVRIKVVVSGQFFGWLAGIGEEAVIAAPAAVQDRYMQWLTNIQSRHSQRSDETGCRKM